MHTRFRCLSFGSALLLLAACSSTPTPDYTGGSSSSSSAMMMEDSSSASSVASSSVEAMDSSGTRIIVVKTDNWSFTPNVITARKGEKVKVRLTGINGTHGFAAPDLGINTQVAAGKTVDVELPTDAAGSFKFFCSIPCGEGHREMTGTIEVTQ